MDRIKKEDSFLEHRARLFWCFFFFFLDISCMNSHLGPLLYRKKIIMCLNVYRLHLELKGDFCSSRISQLSVPERSSRDQPLAHHIFISLVFCLQ